VTSMNHSTLDLVRFAAGLVLVATTAWSQDGARPADVTPAPSVRLTLHVPDPSVPIGAPIDLETTIVTSAAWQGLLGQAWWQQHDDATGDWVTHEFTGPFEIVTVRTEADSPSAMRVPTASWILPKLSVGRWRAAMVLRAGEQRVVSDWCEIEITEHAANRRVMSGELGPGMFMAWQWAVTNSEVTEPVRIPRGALGADGPQNGMEIAVANLVGLRAAGVSPEIAVRADAIVQRREVRRALLAPAGEARDSAARAVASRLDGLLAECDPLRSPLGGQRGELLELQACLWKTVDPSRARRIADEVRDGFPFLEQRLR
jgi:hypothetical protein